MNYQKISDEIISTVCKQESRPTLLLHSCCAPCSSYVLEYLSQYFDITVFYYNPNIDCAAEFEKRSAEQQRLIKEMKTKYIVHFLSDGYDNEKFQEISQGMENEKEGGARCEKCFKLRLEESVKKAKALDFDYFTTTLSISPLKNSQLLNHIGEELEKHYDVKYFFSDFKKREGYKRSTQLSSIYGLYRQNYCGCIYSKNEALERGERP